MKSTTNVFQEGLRTDLHPLATGQQYLTDALNATLLTFNGNEMMLQNDMGNTRIQDSATGGVIGLRPGFIPTGFKEHGGIMYITSVNNKGEGEVGTIPSPIIRNFYKDKISYTVEKTVPVDKGDALIISHKLYPTDKFMVNVQMDIKDTLVGEVKQKSSIMSPTPGVTDPCDIILKRTVIKDFATSTTESIYTPLISYNDPVPTTVNLVTEGIIPLFSHKGIYKLDLFSTNENGSIPAGDALLERQVFHGGISNYWYLHTDNPTTVFPSDLLNATLNSNLKQFPSSNKPGKLAVRLTSEKIDAFGLLPRSTDPYYTPITLKSYDSDGSHHYYTFFTGFYYTTNSGIYIDKLKNIKVINENTGQSMPIIFPHGGSSAKTYQDITCTSLSTSTTGINSVFLHSRTSTPALFTGNTLPQILSKDTVNGKHNTFIITPIPTIDSHLSRLYTSSTVAVDESDHSGVFCVDIGQDYNQWYRAEVDYFDQYDVYQGTFRLKFNPFVNDVFGTNLSLETVDISTPALIMGQQFIPSDQTFTVSGPSPTLELNYLNEPTVISDKGFKASNLVFDCPLSGDPRFSNAVSFYYVDNKTMKKAASGSQIELQYSTTTFSDLLSDPYYNYCYSYNKGITKESFTGPQVTHNTSSIYVGFGYQDSDHTDFYRSTTRLDKPYLMHAYDNDVYFVKVPAVGRHTFRVPNIKFDGTTVFFGNTESTNFFITHDSTDWGMPMPRDIQPYVGTKSLTFSLFSAVRDSKDPKKITALFRATPLASYQAQFGAPAWGVDDGYLNEGTNIFLHPDRIKWGLLNGEYSASNTDNEACRFRFRLRIPTSNSGTVTVHYGSFDPIYKIIPFVLLKGKNDAQEEVYVQRYEGKTYECNFELGSDSNPYNYIGSSFSGTPTEVKPCSYSYDNPYLCYNDDFVFEQNVQAGIYVLSIPKCPGSTMVYKDGTKQVLVDAQIAINGSSLTSYTLKGFDLATPSFTDGVVYGDTSISGTSHDCIYAPMVLIVRRNSTLKIKIQNTEASNKFTRQSIGLYKIKNVATIDILSELASLTKDVYEYSEYMKEISRIATSTNKVHEYNTMQKFGVFFRGAYVFVDGICDTYKKLQNITIYGTTFYAYPFIPSDPSILPVEINGGKYIWNAYFMPESVLSAPNTSNFIFSNGTIPGISTSTQPLSSNLRQPL